MEPLEVKKGTCFVLPGLLPHYNLLNTCGRYWQAYSFQTISRCARYPGEYRLQRGIRVVKGL